MEIINNNNLIYWKTVNNLTLYFFKHEINYSNVEIKIDVKKNKIYIRNNTIDQVYDLTSIRRISTSNFSIRIKEIEKYIK